MKTVYQDENNVVLVENSVEWKPCINIERGSKIYLSLWTWETVVSAMLGNIARSRVVMSVSLWRCMSFLKISEKFEDLDKMETTSSQSKVKMEGSEKWLVTDLDFKTKARSKNVKRQGMPSEMSVWRTFPAKSMSLKILLKYLIWKGHPNMNPLRVIFI